MELILNPNQVLTVVSEDPGLLCLESHWLEGSEHPPPPHFHPQQDEHFEILGGEVEVKLDGEARTLQAGDTLDVPAGTVHEMRPATEARARWEVRPALRTREMFEALAEMTASGDFSRAAELLEEYAPEFRLAV